MKVVHISYAQIDERDPERWLERINFFCGILERMADACEVWSFHSIRFSGELERNKVHYVFVNESFGTRLFGSAIDKYIQELKPGAVIVHGMGFQWEVLRLQRSLPSTTRLFVQNHAERPFRSYKRWLQILVDRNIDGYFFASRDLAKPWIEDKQIRSANKIHEVMEVSSVFKPISRKEAMRKLNLDDDQGYLWVGRLNENKNPLPVIKVFLKFLDINPTAKLYIIFQEGELLPAIEKLLNTANERSKQIILVGNVAHADMVYWYNCMRYIISSSFYEGSGVAVCEAMSCGCIPILTNIPSFRMMTDNGRIGFLYEPNDEQALVAILKETMHISSHVHDEVIRWFSARLSFTAIARSMLSATGEHH